MTGKNKVIIPESVFDTRMVGELAAADSREFITTIDTSVEDPEGYAKEHDIISVLERRILGFDDQIDDLEANKRVIENAVRWEVEILAEDKDNKLTNETKRQLKYDSIIECNDEFQRLSGDLKVFRREVRKLRIELDNEKRAFQLILRKCGDNQ